MPLPDVLQQSLCRIFHHVQHALEALLTAVIRVGNFALGMMAREFEEQPHLRATARRRKALQDGEVGPVHRQHIIETEKIPSSTCRPRSSAMS